MTKKDYIAAIFRHRAEVKFEPVLGNKPNAADIIKCNKCGKDHAAYIQSCMAETKTQLDDW
jgi:hypothetical protein